MNSYKLLPRFVCDYFERDLATIGARINSTYNELEGTFNVSISNKEQRRYITFNQLERDSIAVVFDEIIHAIDREVDLFFRPRKPRPGKWRKFPASSATHDKV